MYFCWGSSLILQAMDPSFSNFLVWCLDISGGTRFRVIFLLATPQRECNKYSTGFPQNPWFVGLWVDIFLLKKPWLQTENTRSFTKIVETKDQNCPKSQAGVVDYGHEPERMMWQCGMALPLLFTFTSWGFFQVYSKGQEGRMRRMLWMQSRLYAAEICTVSLLCSSVWWRRNNPPKKNIHAPASHLEIWYWTFTNSWWTWRVPKKHPSFLEKMNICNPTVHPDLASSMSAKSQPMFRMGTLPAPFTLFLAIFQTYPQVI